MKVNFPKSQCGGLWLLILLTAVLGGCSEQPEQAALTVAAAASHAAAFEELGPAFTAETGKPIQFVYASTGHLSQQILNGAPYDVFVAADLQHFDPLSKEGLTLGEPTPFAAGQLALVTSRTASQEDGWDPHIFMASTGRISIANPAHAPYGAAAKETLEALELWAPLQNRIVYGESVRQAFQIVHSGNAEFGLVAASLVEGENYAALTVPSHLYTPVLHSAVILSASQQIEQAQQFIDFLRGPAGSAILARYGLNKL